MMHGPRCGYVQGFVAQLTQPRLLLPQASFSNGDEVLSDWRDNITACSWSHVICRGSQVVGL